MKPDSKLIDCLRVNGRLFFKGQEISKDRIFHTILFWSSQCKEIVADFPFKNSNDKYIVFLGSSNLDFLLATLFASFHGLKMILANRKNLAAIIEQHAKNISILISTISTDHVDHPVVHLNSLEQMPANTLLGQNDFFQNDRGAEIVFCTSGTTSIQKLVVYDEHVLFSNAKVVSNYLKLNGKSCLVFFPLNYMYGFATSFSTMIAGGSLYLEEPNIDIYEIFDYMTRIDVLPLINLYVNQLKKVEKNLRFEKVNPNLIVINASDTFYEDSLKYIFKFCRHFWNNFGQTESGPRIFSCYISREEYFSNPAKFALNGIIALGLPITPEIKIELVDSSESFAKSEGVMHYNTPFRMKGYLSDDGTIINQSSQISSQDIFTINSSGYYCFVSRKKNFIKENGRLFNLELINSYFTNNLSTVEHCRAYFSNGSINLHLKLLKMPKGDLRNAQKIYHDVCKKEYRKIFRNYPPLGEVEIIKNFIFTDTGKIKFFNIKNAERAL